MWRDHSYYNPRTKQIKSNGEKELLVSNSDIPSKPIIMEKIWYTIKMYLEDFDFEQERDNRLSHE